MTLPDKVLAGLRMASMNTASAAFSCNICGNEWDRFIEHWAARSYAFVREALGPYQQEPLTTLLPLSDGAHSSGANASFEPATGQIRLSGSVCQNKPGLTLEKITHELVHASLADFPEKPDGDPFFEEGYVDYAVWVMAHAPAWGPYRAEMIKAAEFNIAMRRDRAMRSLSEYDAKRWAGGLFAANAYGPWIVTKLAFRKREGNLTWV